MDFRYAMSNIVSVYTLVLHHHLDRINRHVLAASPIVQLCAHDTNTSYHHKPYNKTHLFSPSYPSKEACPVPPYAPNTPLCKQFLSIPYIYKTINVSNSHVLPRLHLRPTFRLRRRTPRLTPHEIPPSTPLLTLPPPLTPLLHRPPYLLTNLIK